MLTEEQKQLVIDYIPLAISISVNYIKIGKYERDDINQVAYLGLIEAAKNFDATRGFKFSTYAYPIISGRLHRMYRDDKDCWIKRGVKNEYIKIYMDDEENNIQLESEEESIDDRIVCEELLSYLTERQYKVFRYYFYEGYNTTKISKILSISQPTVSRTLKSGIERIKRKVAITGKLNSDLRNIS